MSYADVLSHGDLVAAIVAAPADADWDEGRWDEWFRRWGSTDGDGRRAMVAEVERRQHVVVY